MKYLNTNRIYTIPFLGLIGIYLFVRLFSVGVYHDDWSTLIGAGYHGQPFSFERLNWSVNLLFSRPVYAISLYLFGSMANSSVLAWSIVLAVLGIITVISTKKAIESMFGKSGSSLVVSCLLVLFPWSLGGVFFGVAAFGSFIATILFNISAINLVRYLEQKKIINLIVMGLTYLLGSLTYEIYQFQFLILLGIVLVSCPKARYFVNALSVYALITGLSIFWNRFSLIKENIVKIFNPDWFSYFIYNVRIIGPKAVTSLGYFGPIFAMVLTVILLSIVVDWRKYRRELTGLLVLLFGVLVSLLLYSVVGYGVTESGIMSRTMFVFSYYLCFIFFIIYQLTIKRFGDRWGMLFLGFMVFIVVINFNREAKAWVGSWEIQRQILASKHIGNIAKLPPDTIVLYRGPSEYERVTVFQAYWDITSAVRYSRAGSNLKTTITPAPDYWITKWDGKKLIQKAKENNSIVGEYGADNVFVWEPVEDKFYPFKAGDEI